MQGTQTKRKNKRSSKFVSHCFVQSPKKYPELIFELPPKFQLHTRTRHRHHYQCWMSQEEDFSTPLIWSQLSPAEQRSLGEEPLTWLMVKVGVFGPLLEPLPWSPLGSAALVPVEIYCTGPRWELLPWSPLGSAALVPVGICCPGPRWHLLAWSPLASAALVPVGICCSTVQWTRCSKP